jgi:hypothetical protein
MSFTPDRKDLFLDINVDKAYSFLFLGSTRSGKSTLMEHLISRYIKGVNILMTESPAGDLYSSNNSFKKSCIMAPMFMPNIIKLAYKINKNTSNHYQFNFIVDDMVSGKNNSQLKKALTIYRNSRIGIMISSQSLTLALDKTSRSNVNFIFLMRCNNDDLIRDIIKAYLSSWFPSDLKMDDKIKLYKEYTKNYHFICINNLTDEVFISKVKI